MKNKILELLEWAKAKASPLNVSQGAMRYIVLYALLLVFCCALYVYGWCTDWMRTGHPDLPEMRNFLHEIASASWVAVIGFIAKAFVDKDNDGIPDEYESEEKEK